MRTLTMPDLVPHADLAGSRADNLQAAATDLTNANLQDVSFSGCSLSRAIFAGARFDRAVVRECTLDNVSAAGASFAGAALKTPAPRPPISLAQTSPALG